MNGINMELVIYSWRKIGRNPPTPMMISSNNILWVR